MKEAKVKEIRISKNGKIYSILAEVEGKDEVFTLEVGKNYTFFSHGDKSGKMDATAMQSGKSVVFFSSPEKSD